MNSKVIKEMDFSKEKLERIMKSQRWSQSFLAKMTNLSQSSISYYLKGTNIPSKTTVQVLAKTLQVEYEDLIDNGEVEELKEIPVENKESESEYQDILEVAQEMGNLRYKLIQMVQEATNNENGYNAQSLDFLHGVENIEDIEKLTPEEAFNMLKKAHIERKKRRNCKERKYLIQLLLDGFLIKNPTVYIARVIEKSKDWTYISRVAEQLKYNPDLYDLRKEQKSFGKDDINKHIPYII